MEIKKQKLGLTLNESKLVNEEEFEFERSLEELIFVTLGRFKDFGKGFKSGNRQNLFVKNKRRKSLKISFEYKIRLCLLFCLNETLNTL